MRWDEMIDEMIDNHIHYIVLYVCVLNVQRKHAHIWK